tara:strand:- start:140 stop:1060 length:921 start_codon:yes stop_codon:yes gene_type:complete
MTISVVIPYYNESDTLLLTLQSLKNQSLQPNEIIFIDSGSTDNSTSIIESFADNNKNYNIKSYKSGSMSPSTSINLGVKTSTSDIIAYTDCGLDIPNNWLESNHNLMIKTKASIVSSKFFTKGKSIIDMSFVAHTYGCGSFSTVLPGSLIKKTIIEDIGYFLPGVRANYDVDFINKVTNLGIKRVVNESVTMKYIGIEYCVSFMSGFLKISKYSENAWKVRNDFKPVLYLIGLIMIISSIYLDHIHTLLLTYFILRGFLLPLAKSSFGIMSNIPLLLTLPITGAVIDISRVVGYLQLSKILYRQTV